MVIHDDTPVADAGGGRQCQYFSLLGEDDTWHAVHQNPSSGFHLLHSIFHGETSPAHGLLHYKRVHLLRIFFEIRYSYQNEEEDVLVVVVDCPPKNRREEVNGLIRPSRTIENLILEWWECSMTPKQRFDRS